MFIRALSLAAKRAVGVTCRRADGFAHQFHTPLPQSTLTAAATAVSTSNVIWQRSISTSPPLLSSSDKDDKGDEEREEISDEKKSMISRWMKWNTSKTWRYEPNHDLIAKIGKEGTKSNLDQFRDLVTMDKRDQETVGRSWSAKELRRKSYDDLHKLWYVLYKEKNMLLTEANLARRHGYNMVQSSRRQKIRKSMGAVKHVLGERKRKKMAGHKAYLEKLEQFDGLVAKMKLKGDDVEEAMETEADKLSFKET
mmetsp:Transcript_1265/g.2027  ORF Transcript_1265/g.2027 Transcript_1265/m.2027 type:complete len:253 (-) Transcript_1265:57-815(-)